MTATKATGIRTFLSRYVVSPELAENHDFLKLWAGQTVSLLGSAITNVALPLTAILILHATASDIGVLMALRWLPSLLFGLIAGAWVDRLRRRVLMIAADLGRFVLLGLVPVTAAIHMLSLVSLDAIAFLSATLSLLFLVAYGAYLPGIVDRAQLVEGNSKLSISRSAAQVGGPGSAGVLVQLVTAPMAILADAISFLVSALCLSLINRPEPMTAHPGQRRIVREIRGGLREVFTRPLLRSLAVANGIANLFWSAQVALFVLYMSRTLGLSAAAIGVIFATGNVGLLIASLLAKRVTSWYGVGRTIVTAPIVGIVGAALIPLAHGSLAFVLLIAAQITIAFALMFYEINTVSLRQAIVPAALQGRVTATMRTVGYGAAPLGALLAGGLGEAIGIRPTLWIIVGGLTLVIPSLVFSPLWSMRAAGGTAGGA